MTMTDNLAVVALLISMASLIVAIASIVMSAKNKQAGAVEPRTRAIEQIREALFDLRQNQSLTPKAIASITKAKNLADIVFSKRVRGDLDQVLGSAHEIAASVRASKRSGRLRRASLPSSADLTITRSIGSPERWHTQPTASTSSR